MKNFILIFQIVIALSLIAAILLQNRGQGLSSSLGGGGGEFYRSKRGLEKILYRATIVLSILFLLFSIAALIV